MRDNLIILEPFVDEYGLCKDLCKSMEGTAGILVWGSERLGGNTLFHVCLGLSGPQLLGSVSIHELLASETGKEAIILRSIGDS
jgi:hypothetical protein